MTIGLIMRLMGRRTETATGILKLLLSCSLLTRLASIILSEVLGISASGEVWNSLVLLQ